MCHSNHRNVVLIGLLCLFSSFGAFALTGSGDTAVTPLETVSPQLESVSAVSDASLTATYTEQVRDTAATTPGNYTAVGGGIGTLAPNPTTATGTGPYTLDWASGEMQEARPLTVTVTGVQDAVGNPIQSFGNHATCMGKGTAPVFSDLVATPPRAAEAAPVEITFTVSETLVTDPSVTVNGHAVTLGGSTKTVPYTYTYTVQALDALGMAEVAISGWDLAGNTGTLANSGVLEIIPKSTLPLIVWPAVLALLVAGIAATAWRRKRLAVVLLAAALLASSSAFAASPAVTNVTMSQNPNETSTQVDISFDLEAPNGPCSILLSLSKEGGADDFIFPITHYTGDIASVATGTGKHIVWDIRADYPEENIPQASIRVLADDAIVQHTLTYTAGEHGSITGTSPQTIIHGSDGTAVTAVPDTGYHFVRWSDDNTDNPRTDLDITLNVAVTAEFAINTYAITCDTVGSGTCTADPATVDHGSTSDITVTPAEGWHIVSIEDSVEGTKSGSYTTTAVTANRTVTATFAINTYVVTCGAVGNGVCIASPAIADYGSTSDIAVTPPDHYHIVSVVDSVEGAKSGSYTTTAVTANRTVTATFAIDTFTLAYTAGEHGSVTGDSPQPVDYGGSGTTVTAVPDSGYMFSQWTDGVLTAARTDSNVSADISVTANFLPPPVVTSLAINEGAATTMSLPVLLNNVTANSPAEYMASESATFAGAVWQAYAAAPSFTLSFGVGTRTVYFKTRNAAGESNVVNDTIFIVPALSPVPAITFNMGRTSDLDDAAYGQADELPVHEVKLSAYQIRRLTVTVKEYCDVLNWANSLGWLHNSSGGAYTGGDVYGGADLQCLICVSQPYYCHVQYVGGVFSAIARQGVPAGTSYSTDMHPVGKLPWYGAAAYCNLLTAWQNLATGSTMATCYGNSAGWPLTVPPPNAGGYRLPTEAEWECAAAWDGTKHWIYGFTSDTLTDNTRCNYNGYNPFGLTDAAKTSPGGWYDGTNVCPNGNVQTVKSVSPWGCYDMCGNQYQWLNDWYGAYSSAAQVNPTGPASGTARVCRGGAFSDSNAGCRTARRYSDGPGDAKTQIGFRIARTDTQQYVLTYTSGTGGSISGTSPQTVALGGNGTQVTAQASTGYVFAQWSDGVLTASRTDANVTGNVTVTASFVLIPVISAFNINSGASTASSTTVTLNNTATGSPTQYMASESSSFTGASWLAYDTAPSFTLSSGVGTRTVYLKVKNDYAQSATRNDSIFLTPATLSVPLSSFTMGRTNAGDDATYGTSQETPQHTVSLEAFLLGMGETTNREYCDVLNWAKQQHYIKDSAGADWLNVANSGDIYAGGNSGRHKLLAITQADCNIQYADGVFSAKTRVGLPGSTNYSTGDHPVTNVTWFGAVAFCNWLSEWQGLTAVYEMSVGDWPLTTSVLTAGGYRLPTEAEWERAAAWNGTYHFVYGFTSDSLSGNNSCNYQVLAAPATYVNPLGLTTAPYTCPVFWFNGTNVSPNGGVATQLSKSPVGAYGMSGNAVEWCHDWYNATYYSGGAMTCPTGPASGTSRAYRGGQWNVEGRWSRTAARDGSSPSGTNNTFGFRLARTAATQYLLTYAAGANGTLSGTRSQIVPSGGSGTAVTVVPNAHCHFVNWNDSSTQTTRTDTNVTANISVTANFAINTYTLTYTAGTHGTITGASPQTVSYGGSGTAVTAVANSGYGFVKWSDGSTVNPRTDTNVTANCSVTATFLPQLSPEMVSVAWCDFTMGRIATGDDATYGKGAGYDWMNEDPQHQVLLGAYQLGRYDVTNLDYCAILNYALARGYLKTSGGAAWAGTGDIYAGGNLQIILNFAASYCNIQYSGGVFTSKTRVGLPGSTNYSMDTHPVIGVSWYGAVAFCNWLSQWQGLTPCYDMTTANWPLTVAPPTAGGYRLPTEAEWERAAAWKSSTHKTYGFGGDYLGTFKNRCNDATDGTAFVNPLGLTTEPYTSPVGWFNPTNVSPNGNVSTVPAPSPVGAYDMCGNAWQWVQDWATQYSGGAVTNPTGPASGVYRVARGGSWYTMYYDCRSARRSGGVPTSTNNATGFRLARTAVTQYALTYTTDITGSISGVPRQMVVSGGSGTTVTAVCENSYYAFSKWSDGVLTATRTDTNVTGNINVQAIMVTNEPVVTSFAINNGAATTTSLTVTLNNTATFSPTEYMASESPMFTGATWHTYSSAPTFTLSSGAGIHNVHFKVRNASWPSLGVMDSISVTSKSASVGAGTFTMGRTAPGDDATGSTSKDPQRQVTLSAYPLGKYSVTNKEYCDVLNWALAQRYPKTSAGWDSNFNDCRSARYGNIAPATSNDTFGLRLAGSN